MVQWYRNEKLIDHFTCALLINYLLLHGRIYITSHRLIFHSYFNSTNLFFGETVLSIPQKDIQSIEKRKNAYFFDNSIQIQTINGNLFFTSFLHRDNCFELINTRLIQLPSATAGEDSAEVQKYVPRTTNKLPLADAARGDPCIQINAETVRRESIKS